VIAETPTAADATGGRRALDPAGGKPVHGVPLPEPSCLGSYGHSNFTTEGQQAVADRETGRSCGHECPGHQPRPPWARTDAGTGTGEPTPARPATFGAVCAVGEFRVLWLADVLSLLGDQLARVALAVLVFGRTGSALLTGLVYALSFLPALVGGPLLAGLADRLPRRRLMVSCDLARGLVVAVMAAPGAPLWLLCALLVGAVLLTAPFTAARAALLPDVLPDDRYVLASAINNITDQGAQVLGFAVGGGLAAVLGSSMTLGIDAATFVASALLLQLGLAHRPAPSDPKEGTGRPSALRSALAGSRLIGGDARLRALLGYAWLCGFSVVPEGLAAPYAAAEGAGAGTVGLLMAAQPTGAVLGAVLLARFVAPARRLRLMGPLAVLSCAPLLGCALRPGIPITLALLAVSGLGTAFQLAANAAFVQAVPAAVRGQVFGLAQAGIITVQGAAILLAGAVASRLAPALVVAGAGGLGTAAAARLIWSLSRAERAAAQRAGLAG